MDWGSVRYFNLALIIICSIGATGCTTLRSIFVVDGNDGKTKPIANPFNDFYSGGKNEPNQNIILRTKKGDRSVEVELPGDHAQMSDFVIPMSPAFRDGPRGSSGATASAGSSNYSSSGNPT